MKSIAKLKDEARRHEQREEWEKAITVYLQVLEESAVNETEVELPLYNRVGDLCVRLGRPQEAVRYYEQAADRYADAGLYNNAIALCNKALRHNADNLELLKKLGQFSASQGFLTDARRYFLEYAEKKAASGKVNDALNALEDFANVSDDAEIRELLGRKLQQYDRSEEAIAELKRALALRVKAGQTDAADTLRQEIRAIDPAAALDDGAAPPRPTSIPTPVQPEPEEMGLLDIDPGAAFAGSSDTGNAGDTGLLAGFETGRGDEDDGFALDLPGFDIPPAEAAPPATVALEGFESTTLEIGEVQPLEDLGLERDETSFDDSVFDLPGLDDVEAAGGFDLPTLDDDDDASGGFDLPTLDDGDSTSDFALPGLDDGDSTSDFALPTLDDGDSTSDFALPTLDDGDADGGFTLPTLDGDDAATGFDLPTLENDDSAGGFDLPALDDEDATGSFDLPTLADDEAGVEPQQDGFGLDAGAFDLTAADDEEEATPFDMATLEDEVEVAPFDMPTLEDEVEAAASTEFDVAATADDATEAQAPDHVADPEPPAYAGGWTPDDLPASTAPKPAAPAAGSRAGAKAPSDGFVDLNDLFSDDPQEGTRFRIQETAPTGDEDRDFADMLNQFRAKVSEHLPPEDAAAHYDLGLAFKEMGLVDEAISEFQIALRSGHMKLKVYEELGQCFLTKQQFNIAEKVLRRAMEMKYDDELELIGVYYHLGRAYEGMGQRDHARDAYERVLGMDINFQDVMDRLARL